MKDRRVARAWRMLSALALVAALFAISAELALARTAAPRLAATSSYPATIRDGRAAARALLEQTGATSLSLALVDHGHVVWQQGFGYADTATSARPQASTMYGIGSVSKMFATIATMKLVDQGKVALDAPLTRYLPEFRMASPEYRQITVRMLLNHSSGFPGSEYHNVITSEYFPGYALQTMESLAAQRIKHTPGFMNVYCNDGFTMVENLVLAITGKTYAQFVTDEILTPLGMSHTAYPLEPFADGTYAKVYTGSTANPREVVNTLGSGGAYSTPTDMGKLATMLANGGTYRGTRILAAASVAEMGKDQTLGTFNPAPANGVRYGLGWDSVTEPGLKAVRVTGWMKGGDTGDYHAGFTVAAKARMAVVVTGVTPLGSGGCETLGQRILLRALVEKGALRRMPRQIAAVAPPLKTASSARLSTMKGYWAMSGMVFRIAASPGSPQALTISRLTPDGWATLANGVRLRTDGRFHADGSSTSFRTVTAAGRRYLVDNAVGGYGHFRDDSLIGQKLRPREALSAAWRGRLGRTWLAVNELPDSAIYAGDGGPVLSLGEIPGLPGYATVTTAGSGLQVVDPGVSDALAAMFLQIPQVGSRDLADAIVEQRDSEDWMRYSSTLYRPQATVPALAEGSNSVSFGDEGFAEWRVLPSAAGVQIDAGTAWRLYDAELRVVDSGSSFPATGYAPEPGSNLLLFGPAGSSATVSVDPDAAPQGRATAPHRKVIIQLR